jgi:hypothetical protein
MPKFVPGPTVARVDLVPQWDTQHNSPAQSLTADVPYHELARRCVLPSSDAVESYVNANVCYLLGQFCLVSLAVG